MTSWENALKISFVSISLTDDYQTQGSNSDSPAHTSSRLLCRYAKPRDTLCFRICKWMQIYTAAHSDELHIKTYNPKNVCVYILCDNCHTLVLIETTEVGRVTISSSNRYIIVEQCF
jgi:hypothetical protein